MAKLIPDSSKNRWSELVEIIEDARRQYYVLDSPTISDDEYDKSFKELEALETKYPEWINVDWDSIEHKLDDPIVIQLFEREAGEYWDALIQAVPDTLRN